MGAVPAVTYLIDVSGDNVVEQTRVSLVCHDFCEVGHE